MTHLNISTRLGGRSIARLNIHTISLILEVDSQTEYWFTRKALPDSIYIRPGTIGISEVGIHARGKFCRIY
jgi:hypothetical protein